MRACCKLEFCSRLFNGVDKRDQTADLLNAMVFSANLRVEKVANKTKYQQTDDSILLNMDSLQDALQCGRHSATRIAKEAGAEVRIGGRVLYNRKKIEDYINANTGR